MKFIDLLNEEGLKLVVSCPKNDYEYVKAAWENGADAVKIHLNVHHHASGTDFGSAAQERAFIEKVIANSPVPVGVVVGGSPEVVNDDLKNVLAHDFEFLSLYLHDATPQVVNQDKLTRMFACSYAYSLDEIKMWSQIGAEVAELSIVHPDDYGKPLNMRDLLHYKQIIDAIDIPAALPTQKKVRIEELGNIKDLDFKAIMIGAVVTGNEYEGFVETIKSFRAAIDAL